MVPAPPIPVMAAKIVQTITAATARPPPTFPAPDMDGGKEAIGHARFLEDGAHEDEQGDGQQAERHHGLAEDQVGDDPHGMGSPEEKGENGADRAQDKGDGQPGDEAHGHGGKKQNGD